MVVKNYSFVENFNWIKRSSYSKKIIHDYWPLVKRVQSGSVAGPTCYEHGEESQHQAALHHGPGQHGSQSEHQHLAHSEPCGCVCLVPCASTLVFQHGVVCIRCGRTSQPCMTAVKPRSSLFTVLCGFIGNNFKFIVNSTATWTDLARDQKRDRQVISLLNRLKCDT